MPPVEEDEQGVFDEEDVLDDSDGDDSEMDLDDDEDDDEGFPEAPPLPQPTSQPMLYPKEEPISSIFLSPDPSPNPNRAAVPTPITPQNGSITAVPIPFTPQAAHMVSPAEEFRRPMSAASMEDSRRLFQRLWTDEDEITILQGFLEFTTQRGTTHASHQYDTGPFYEQIKKQLQLEFNKNQLIEKLRRLKKKYRNVVNRMVSGKEFSFKSAHEQATFEISRKIWSASIKRAHDSEDDEFVPNPCSAIVELDSGFGAGAVPGDGMERRPSWSARRRIRRKAAEEEAAAAAVAGAAVEVPIAAPLDPQLSAPLPGIIEETVRSCLSPLFKEILQSAMAGCPGGMIPGIGGSICGGMNHLQWGMGNSQGIPAADDKWRNQQILELEVYLKRIELVRDHIKLTLEELKSSTTPSSAD